MSKCKLRVKDKVLFLIFVLFLGVMSFAAGDYYKSLWVLFGVFGMGMYTVIKALKEQCIKEQ
jgi:hypothetical protein